MAHPIQTYTLNEGFELSFTDTGAPPNSLDYTTILMLHGGAFNAYGFYKMNAYAHSLNLRLILLNRRNYAGSTPYSPSEIQELEQGNVVFWERLSAQLGEFLKMFVEREGIPKLIPRQMSFNAEMEVGKRGSGGVAIFGWSGGCLPIISFLGATQNSMMSEELYNFLIEYVGDCIFYEPSYHCFGYPLPPDNRNYIPWEDTTRSPEEFFKTFSQWVSSYYDHSCYDPVSHSLRTTASINDLDGQRHKSDEISVSSWTDEEIAKGMEERPAKHEISTFLPAVQQTLRVLAEQALFDQERIRAWFPDIEISHIGGTRSNWVSAWAMIQTKKRYLQRIPMNGDSSESQRLDRGGAEIRSSGRRIRFFDMDGANHFAHWDRPEELLQLVAEGIRSHWSD